MNPKIFIKNSKDEIVETITSLKKFPDGAIMFRNESEHITLSKITICALITDAEWLFFVGLLKSAYMNMGVKEIHLDLPYVPYCRQDRVCNPGESFSLKVVCEFINSMKFDSVTIYDPHSPLSVLEINNCKKQTPNHFIHSIINFENNNDKIGIVFPDKGANLKSAYLYNYLAEDRSINVIESIVMDKKRNSLNGKIEGMKLVSGNPDNCTKLFLVDDIIDGGMTFIKCAECLRDEYNVSRDKLQLIVSHGLFTNKDNVDILNSLYSKIHTKYNY